MTEQKQAFGPSEDEGILPKDRFTFIPFSEQKLNRRHTINLTPLVGNSVTPTPVFDQTDLCDACHEQPQATRKEFTTGWGYPEERLEVVVEDALQLKCGCSRVFTTIMGSEYQPVMHAADLIYKGINSENPRVFEDLETILPFEDVEKVRDFTFNRKVSCERKTPPYIPQKDPVISLPLSEYTIK